MENIDAASIQDLYLKNNISLSSCEVQSVCDYLSTPNGIIEIYDNAPGCNSQQEVEDACITVNIEEGSVVQELFTFYPNPATENVKISCQSASSIPVLINIYNNTGSCVRSYRFSNNQTEHQEFDINISDLPSGIYFLRLQIGNEVVTEKLVKL